MGRNRMRSLSSFGIVVVRDARTYLLGSPSTFLNKAGHTSRADERMIEIRRASRLDLYEVAAVGDPDFEQEVFEHFGRRDPFYDGDGKTEWPAATLEEVYEFFLANGARETWATDAVLSAQPAQTFWLPPTIEVAEFQAITARQILEVAA